MNAEALACFAFSNFFGIGPMGFLKLKSFFSSIQTAYEAPKTALGKILGPITLEKFLEFRTHFNPKAEFLKLTQKQINYLPITDSHYPFLLKQISDPPIGLFYKGEWEKIDFSCPFLAIVGTRKPSFYGQRVAEKMARVLAEKQMVIVSGLAQGIDTCSHQGALSAAGKTIAVLGCGVDIIYPSENQPLYQKIISGGGLILSEFPPGTTTKKGLFVSRNRIISGLSRGVLVVEGGEHSGSLITAKYAASQGRDIFAVPGQAGSQNAQAPLLLLKQGAILVTEPEDILDEWKINMNSLKKTTQFIPNLPQDEQLVFAKLANEPQTTDELLISLNLDYNLLITLLSSLELSGLIIKDDFGKWITA